MSWQRVRGHEGLAQAFQRVVKRGRLAHAYLFTGPEGVGKKRFAVELGKAILCERPKPGVFEGCDTCPACLQVDAGTHPDFTVAAMPEDKQEFPIEVMREVCQKFSLKSARGKGKVAVIDDADDLNEESANCFLKTLEEPPPRSVIVLIGTSPDRQLATIVSRCQIVNFSPLPSPVVVEMLRQEGIQDEALLSRLAVLGEGSPGSARALSDPALWEFRGQLLHWLTEPRPDGVALGKKWSGFVEEAGKDGAQQRPRASLCIGLLLSLLQDALRLSLGVEPRLADAEERRALATLSQRLDPEQLLDLIERCLEGDIHVDRRVQLVLILEALTDALAERLQRGTRSAN